MIPVLRALLLATLVSACAPQATPDPEPRPRAEAVADDRVKLIVLNNGWIDYTMYGRTSGGWMRLCAAGSHARTDCTLPEALTVGATPLTLKAESRLWQKAKVFDPMELPRDATAILIHIQNHVATSYIAGVETSLVAPVPHPKQART